MSALGDRQPARWPRHRPAPTDARLLAAVVTLKLTALSSPQLRALANRKVDQAIAQICERAGINIEARGQKPWLPPRAQQPA